MPKSLYSRKIFSNSKAIAKVSEVDQTHAKEKQSKDTKNVFTIEKAIDHIGFGWFQIKLLLITCFAYVSLSFNLLIDLNCFFL